MSKIRIFVVSMILILAIFGMARAGNVTFGWDAYADAAATGFKLYCAPTSDVPITAANLQATITPTTLTTYTKTGMAPGLWYCALTAYNATTESTKSNVVTFTVPLTPPANFHAAVAALLATQGGDSK